MNYFKFNLISNDGRKLIYPMDQSLFTLLKYEWKPENRGIGGGVIHAVCRCQSDELTLQGATKITKAEYDDIDKIDLVTDRVDLPGQTVAKIRATMPENKGKVTFKVVYPDGASITHEQDVDVNGIANMPDFKTDQVGKIRITLFSNIHFAPQIPRKVIEIDST